MDKKKRRANILYRLRKKGVRCNTKEREIYFPLRQRTYEGGTDKAVV